MSINIEKMITSLTSILSKNEISKVYAMMDEMVNHIRSNKQIDCNSIYAIFESHQISNENISSVLDAVRHAFTSYCVGGLHDLYCYMENGDWYPPVELKSMLMPNDNEKLPDVVEIFRGCCVKEYNQEQFGQAWTTDIEIARLFAYSHYESQPWFHKSDRVVLSADIDKEDVLFSRNLEAEIVVQTNKLKNVKIIT